MKYIKKLPTTDKELSNQLISEGWTRLEEPSKLSIATLLSIPFAFLNGAIFIFIAFYLQPSLKNALGFKERGFNISLNLNLITLIVIFVFLISFMIIHELTHACFVPNVLKSDNVYWGINGLYGFVYTTEKIKKERFLIVAIMPLFLLSFLLPCILNALGLLNIYTFGFCLLNACGSCVDCLSICLISMQVPRDAYVINNGVETYFK